MNRKIINVPVYKGLILLIFIFLSLSLIAQNKEDDITIKNKSISLGDAFSEIEKQTDYTIAYEQSSLDLKRKISLSLKEANINSALKQILKDTDSIYKIKGYHIIISKSPKEERKQKKAKKRNK